MQLRILVIHNSYQHLGGEDSVVASEIQLLRSHGHEVETYYRSNAEISTMSSLSVAIQTLWSFRAAHELTAMIRDFRPDVIHVHNTFPLMSPSVYWAAARARVPVVQTLHNFRLICLSAMFLRDGKVCEQCVGRFPWRGVGYKCYRDSRAASFVLAAMLLLHRGLGTFNHKVSRYIVLNNFCRSKFVVGGLPSALIAVKPNFVSWGGTENSSAISSHASSNSFKERGARSSLLFVGRLSIEKGVESLVRAAALVPDVDLRVIGDGPLEMLLDGVQGVSRLGRLGTDSALVEMSKSIAVVVPSICNETFGLVVIEAFANGTPVIASRIGALAELVSEGETGLLVEPGNAQDLAEKMAWALSHSEQMAEMGRRARIRYRSEFTAEKNYMQLMKIYEGVIGEHHDKK